MYVDCDTFRKYGESDGEASSSTIRDDYCTFANMCGATP